MTKEYESRTPKDQQFFTLKQQLNATGTSITEWKTGCGRKTMFAFSLSFIISMHKFCIANMNMHRYHK